MSPATAYLRGLVLLLTILAVPGGAQAFVPLPADEATAAEAVARALRGLPSDRVAAVLKSAEERVRDRASSSGVVNAALTDPQNEKFLRDPLEAMLLRPGGEKVTERTLKDEAQQLARALIRMADKTATPSTEDFAYAERVASEVFQKRSSIIPAP
ncbi:MAG TPA: hypothetical protein VF590_09540, partial [Isosphaeraceae bacterium]